MTLQYLARKFFAGFAFSSIAVSLLLTAACSTSEPIAAELRPDNWAEPITGKPGLANLNWVNANLYRSAQPGKEGFAYLNTQPSLVAGDRPVKTIVSLRAFNDDLPLVQPDSTLKLEQIRFKTWHPEDEDVIKFLRIATTASMQPVLVHCQHGSDRTGTMVAIYRIAYEGWTKKQATDEMVNGCFGYHPIWQNLLRYIDGLDVDSIKAQVARQGPWQ